MILKKPIPATCKHGDGHIIEQTPDKTVVRLRDGTLVDFDASWPAKVYEEAGGYRIVFDAAQ